MAFKMTGWSPFNKETRMEGPRNTKGNIGEETPIEKKRRLEKEGKTNTKEYKDLIKMFEGPGGYGDEQWDKE